MTADTYEIPPNQDREALLGMFRRIPIGMLEATAHRLLNATRTVRTSRATKKCDDGVERPDTIQEPDFQTQLRAFEIIVAHRVGAPGTRKPFEDKPKTDVEDGSPKGRKAGKGAPENGVRNDG